MGFTVEKKKPANKRKKLTKEQKALIGKRQGYASAGKGSRADRGGAYMHDRWARRSGAHRKGKGVFNPDPKW
jgi:hypothetical protein